MAVNAVRHFETSEQRAVADPLDVHHRVDAELPRGFAAHDAQLLHDADARFGISLRAAARDADGARQRVDGRAPDLDLRAVRPDGRRAARVGVARSHGLGRHAHRDRVPDGHDVRAQEPAAAGAARNLQRRAAPAAALHLEGRIHRAPLLSRVGVRDADRRASRPRCRAHRRRACGGPPARHRQAEREPRAALQGRPVHHGRIHRDAAPRGQGRVDARNVSAGRSAA